ncbi:MAG: ANTAR domain-containing protein [Pseudonocardiales bacterium]|nr:ANTAR domain-containing protein [Pseudonocardiales bacterium]
MGGRQARFRCDCRDDIADGRDAQADARDATADERDQVANKREDSLDERERRLDTRAARFDAPSNGSQQQLDHAAAVRAEDRTSREAELQQREDRQAERDAASSAREQATKRRHTATPRTALAIAFAQIAAHLYDTDTFDEVLSRIAEVTVSTIAGCRLASVTLRENGAFRTAASTHTAATEVDQAQYQANEGPCLDAIEKPTVYAPEFPDQRWPRLGSRPTNSGVQSAVSYRLATAGPLTDASLAGSLNSYATCPHAFDVEAQEIGLVLAAHASVVARAVRERTALEQLGCQLHEALASRDVIGQAKGILMERLRITPEDAFDTLRRTSQRLNLKLREIAQQLAETGEFTDDTDPS